jgi:DeoR/GlpR family transcriptional regulator of sugar metabolism
MIEQSDVCIIAADKSKLRRNAFAKISDTSFADYIITTGEASKKELAVLAKHGIEYINAI